MFEHAGWPYDGGARKCLFVSILSKRHNSPTSLAAAIRRPCFCPLLVEANLETDGRFLRSRISFSYDPSWTPPPVVTITTRRSQINGRRVHHRVNHHMGSTAPNQVMAQSAGLWQRLSAARCCSGVIALTRSSLGQAPPGPVARAPAAAASLGALSHHLPWPGSRGRSGGGRLIGR